MSEEESQHRNLLTDLVVNNVSQDEGSGEENGKKSTPRSIKSKFNVLKAKGSNKKRLETETISEEAEDEADSTSEAEVKNAPNLSTPSNEGRRRTNSVNYPLNTPSIPKVIIPPMTRSTSRDSVAISTPRSDSKKEVGLKKATPQKRARSDTVTLEIIEEIGNGLESIKQYQNQLFDMMRNVCETQVKMYAIMETSLNRKHDGTTIAHNDSGFGETLLNVYTNNIQMIDTMQSIKEENSKNTQIMVDIQKNCFRDYAVTNARLCDENAKNEVRVRHLEDKCTESEMQCEDMAITNKKLRAKIFFLKGQLKAARSGHPVESSGMGEEGRGEDWSKFMNSES